jgi:hypothetical protein
MSGAVQQFLLQQLELLPLNMKAKRAKTSLIQEDRLLYGRTVQAGELADLGVNLLQQLGLLLLQMTGGIRVRSREQLLMYKLHLFDLLVLGVVQRCNLLDDGPGSKVLGRIPF